MGEAEGDLASSSATLNDRKVSGRTSRVHLDRWRDGERRNGRLLASGIFGGIETIDLTRPVENPMDLRTRDVTVNCSARLRVPSSSRKSSVPSHARAHLPECIPRI